MKTRIVAGLVAASLLTSLIFLADPFLILCVVIAFAVLSYLEYDRMLLPDPAFWRQTRVIFLIILTILSMRYTDTLGLYALSFSWVVICLFSVFLGNLTGNFEDVVNHTAKEILGYIYVVSLFAFLIPVLESSELGREYLFLLFLIVFGGDTAAYFIGSRFGRRVLASKVSPNKTLLGAISALFLSMVLCGLWILYMYEQLGNSEVSFKLLTFAPVGSLLAQLGDLFESLLKRSCLQKDSGNFLPGHGGILDRIDGLFLVAPVYYIFLIKVIL